MTGQPFALLVPFVVEKLNEVEWIRVHTPDDESPKKYTFPLPRRTGKMKTIRLDMEFSPEEPSLFTDNLTEEVRDAMTYQAAHDVADLLVNGDTESPDPLLKVLDGEVKKGKHLSDINLSGVVYDVEYHARKDTYEWTAYVALETVYV